MPATLEIARRNLFESLAQQILTFDYYKVGKGKNARRVLAASNADYGNPASLQISNFVAEKLTGGRIERKKLAGQTLGNQFEKLIADYLRKTFLALEHLRPGKWDIFHITARNEEAVTGCEQYSHLHDLAKFCTEHRQLKAALGNDYAISPDVLLTRQTESDAGIDRKGKFLHRGLAERTSLRSRNNDLPLLHACISCKYTLRSDRSQNARSEALNLIRNRKGRSPHIVIVTAECLPSRLASLALGTGDIDCLYHIALPELIQAVDTLNHSDAKDMLETMILGKRIRDISDLPLDLAI